MSLMDPARYDDPTSTHHIIERIKTAVAYEFGVPVHMLTRSATVQQDHAPAKHAAIALAYELTGLSTIALAGEFDCVHSTIWKSIARVNKIQACGDNPAYTAQIESLREHLKKELTIEGLLKPKPVPIKTIKSTVATVFSVDPELLDLDDRHKIPSQARNVAMCLSSFLSDSSMPNVGSQFGERGAGAVFKARNKITGTYRSQRNPDLNQKIDSVIDALGVDAQRTWIAAHREPSKPNHASAR